MMIVVIIFVLLTLVFGLLTFFGYNTANKNFQLAQAATEEAKKNSDAMRAATQELASVKQVLGFASEIPASDIAAAHEAAVTKYGANLPGTAEAKGYRQMLDNKDKELQSKIGELSLKVNELVALDEQYQTLTQRSDEKIAIFKAQAEKATKDLEDERSQYVKSKDFNAAELQKSKDLYDKTIKDATEAITIAKTQAAIADANLEQIAEKNAELSNTIQKIVTPSFETAAGKVVSINQSTNSVFLDIGRASGLRTGTTFSVFDAGNTDAATATIKGAIEVIQILGENYCEAKILRTVISDPIMHGDLVYTPLWKPGMELRFALAGRMVIPGLGDRKLDRSGELENDIDAVRHLIGANGALVDSYMDAEGQLHGDISQDTTYLVKGTGEGLDGAEMKIMAKMENDAKINGVRVINLPELLRRMGWQNSTPVRGYDSLSNGTDSMVQPKSPTPVSTGKVSPLYTDKRSPLFGDSGLDKPVSTGAVSGMYQSKDAPTKASVGSVSPIYKPERGSAPTSTGKVSGIYTGK